MNGFFDHLRMVVLISHVFKMHFQTYIGPKHRPLPCSSHALIPQLHSHMIKREQTLAEKSCEGPSDIIYLRLVQQCESSRALVELASGNL